MNNAPSNRIASAYQFADKVVLHSYGQTPAGFYVACEPYMAFPRTATFDELGQAVLAVLAAFRVEITQPTNWKEVTAAFVKGVGVKSHRKLQESSICCGITEKNDKLEFEPSHNGGTSGETKGFQPISGGKISLTITSNVTEIGSALMSSFARCTTIYEHQ